MEVLWRTLYDVVAGIFGLTHVTLQQMLLWSYLHAAVHLLMAGHSS